MSTQVPLRILYALHQFPPVGSGGTEQLLRWTAVGMRARGHDVRVVSAIPRHRANAVLPALHRDTDGLAVQFLASTADGGDFPERIAREYDDPGAGEAFGRAIDAAHPDVIHFFHLSGLTAAAVEAVTARRIPFMLTVTDFWFECPTVQLLLDNELLCDGPRADRMNCARHLAALRWPGLRMVGKGSIADRPAVAAIKVLGALPGLKVVAGSLRALQSRSATLRHALGQAVAILAPGEHMRQRLIAFGIPAEKVQVVPYGVPVGASASPDIRVGRPTTRPRLIFIGTLSASKGLHLLLEALQMVVDVDADVGIYGQLFDDEYAATLQRLAGNDRRVRFCGNFDNHRIDEILDAADLLVIPSLWNENSPLVLLQALARRCPVLVADVPGLAPHVSPARDGWTFRRGDAPDLARQLRRICADPGARAAVCAAPFAGRSLDLYLQDLDLLYETHVPVRGKPG